METRAENFTTQEIWIIELKSFVEWLPNAANAGDICSPLPPQNNFEVYI